MTLITILKELFILKLKGDIMKTLTIGFFCFLIICLGYQQIFNPNPKNSLSSKIQLNLIAYKAR